MMLARLAVAAVLVLVASASGALADGRVALVIGNSTYAHAGRLPNAENDATDMAAALGRLGFEVTTELDTDFAELNGALRAFSRRSSGADVSLVFYAGHGMELDGVNYLVPVDARLERDTDVRYETATLDDVLAATTGATLQVVILDACRDNPLARSIERTGAQRTIGRGSFAELNEDLLRNQTLVAYAAKAGTTAADGRGRNSPYTSALLEHLEQPLEIGMLFRLVNTSVLEATGGRQEPHNYHSLQGVEHYLGGRPPAEAEILFWQTIAESEDSADYEDYLRRFPDGTFARLARRRMEALADVADVVPPPDVAQLGVAQLRQIAGQGDARAQTELGERYEYGRDGVQQDFGMAVSWFRRAADQGFAAGQAALGVMYGTGRGVAQDYGEAVSWLRRAAEQGLASGQYNLGNRYENGSGVAQDYGEAVSWFRRAAEQGYARGQYNLGVMYHEGRGVDQNYEEAVRLFRRAAEQGLASGQNNLGVMYATGRGVRQDYGEAATWYRRAAEQGLANAQNNLGNRYATGSGVAQDYGEAVSWYRRAAEQGYANAQNNLGAMYETGRGVRQDRQEAARWFRLAADQGHAGALSRLR